MKAFLMYKDQDFDINQALPVNEQDLIQDLELTTLFNAMAQGDQFLFDVAKKVVLCGVSDLNIILYRQNILKDCIKNSPIVRDIYDIAVEAIESEKKHYYGLLKRYPEAILRRSIEVMQMFVVMLKKLKSISYEYDDKFESEGFTVFFSMLKKELGDDYIGSIENHLRDLKLRDGLVISATLGKGNKGTDYSLLKKPDKKQSWIQRIFAHKTPAYAYYISDRDESGFRALAELKNQGINLVANAFAQSNDHILCFFKMLRMELAFYVGCLNLHRILNQ
ncbi:muts domain protein, family 4 [hydrocarbon metagenome]|uniref:Muts domain protein, family 4 n=1 Tax=hydrocarbon metagenome TaxID=938273 RepID=A0A0W8E2D7_9ZZZZ